MKIVNVLVTWLFLLTARFGIYRLANAIAYSFYVQFYIYLDGELCQEPAKAQRTGYAADLKGAL